MIYHIWNKDIKFETGKTYRVTLKSGVQGRYKVLGFFNPSVGKPALKTINKDYGWLCYISLDQIAKIE